MTKSLNSTNNPRRSFGMLFQLVFKRLFDIVAAGLSLLLVSPVLAVIALCIIKENGRPVVFRQPRSGRDNNPFDIFKFRSMKHKHERTSSESPSDPYNWENGVPDDFVFKTASLSNPNITKTGAFIRKYSLDELPQFWNVLKGDMSIIGPRPEIIEITRCYNEHQRQRLAVKPGITGLAQITGRSLNHGEKIKHDLHYVHHFSLWLDAKIAFKTITSVITGKDAV